MAVPLFREDGWLPPGHHLISWEEIVARFGGQPGSRRARLTNTLIQLRDNLRTHNIVGSLLLDGSYISAKAEPGDFDVLLIGPADIQARKDSDSRLAALLDAQAAEQTHGYSLFYAAENSAALPILRTLWNETKTGIAKGSVEVTI